jgi:hypothetical protein
MLEVTGTAINMLRPARARRGQRIPLCSNFVNCYGCERHAHARNRINTGDVAYVYEWGAVEFIPNPYNPPMTLTPFFSRT